MTILLILASITILYLTYEILKLRIKLSPIKSLENKIHELNLDKSKLESEANELTQKIPFFKDCIDQVTAIAKLEEKKRFLVLDCIEKEAELANIQTELFSHNDTLDLAQSGMIKLQYNFGTAKEYEEQLDEIRKEQQDLIKDKRAIFCDKSWTVSGSKSEGQKMINRIIKLGLNAFNYQCDNIILNVKHSNFDRSKEKIEKLKDSIEKLLEVNECYVSKNYFSLKLKELDLVFGYQERLYAEKEEQRAIRVQMQEEEKVRKEIEKAKAEAEKEEQYFEKALAKARKEIVEKSGQELEELNSKIQSMEQQLQEALEKKARAISQAELTKRGHVYIISNIGSFGENVLKIGMTRRFDPMDRVHELGDASVPFSFDVHAIIFSEDAPKLEKDLHSHFTHKRTNQMNFRKEFFNITLPEIESACNILNLQIKLTKIAEAKEYRHTLAKLEELSKKAA